ncbi:hypothetical protein QBC40DRAFT_350201 [Triangularia verruculosa]|uniref:Uncharacterized protein n=1 Tax=Triangularia verruculosa TaxID=2587418 RepID=A0AAN6XD48_9PEZI|nr:hypothetical protein QBC40DRAFT_350201 [Triangularia verruculosa]
MGVGGRVFDLGSNQTGLSSAGGLKGQRLGEVLRDECATPFSRDSHRLGNWRAVKKAYYGLCDAMTAAGSRRNGHSTAPGTGQAAASTTSDIKPMMKVEVAKLGRRVVQTNTPKFRGPFVAPPRNSLTQRSLSEESTVNPELGLWWSWTAQARLAGKRSASLVPGPWFDNFVEVDTWMCKLNNTPVDKRSRRSQKRYSVSVPADLKIGALSVSTSKTSTLVLANSSKCKLRGRDERSLGGRRS